MRMSFMNYILNNSSVRSTILSTNTMRQFHIFHSTGPNRFEEIAVQPRDYAGFVHASSVEEAFKSSQNGEEPWNPFNPGRSTSVGDVIQDGDSFFMVCGMGFEELIAPEEKESELEYPQ